MRKRQSVPQKFTILFPKIGRVKGCLKFFQTITNSLNVEYIDSGPPLIIVLSQDVIMTSLPLSSALVTLSRECDSTQNALRPSKLSLKRKCRKALAACPHSPQPWQ